MVLCEFFRSAGACSSMSGDVSGDVWCRFNGWINVIFFTDTATSEIYTGEDSLSLHDALPIYENVYEYVYVCVCV